MSKLKRKQSGLYNRQKKSAYFFVFPATALLIVFLLVPTILSFYYSFMDYNIYVPQNMKFIGVSNYIKIFTDKEFLQALINTLHFTVFVVPLQCGLALVLALLVYRKTKGAAIFRAAYFSPMVTSMVVISILWVVLYNTDPHLGLINSLLGHLGLGPYSFLQSEKTAMNSIVVMSAWQGAGYQMMIFVAGLQGISDELYEAAAIDGAGTIQKFVNITLPGLRNVAKYIIMITTIQAMRLFTQPYIMTQGGPQNSTKTLVYYIYQQGFRFKNFGYACAITVAFIVIVIALNMLLKRVMRAD